MRRGYAVLVGFATAIVGIARDARADGNVPPPGQVVSSAIGGSASDSFETFRKLLVPFDERITWDTVPDQYAEPNEFPGDFYNTIFPRGLVFTTIGYGRFRVSAAKDNALGTPVLFTDVDPTYTFNAFSEWRVFAPLDGSTFDIDFRVPGSTAPAMARGFGAIFSDVDVQRSTTMEYFHGKTSLGVYVVPAVNSGNLSFVGVDFNRPVVTRVVVTMLGQLGMKDVTSGGTADVVAMDDMLFAEITPASDPRVRLDADRDSGDVVYSATVDNPSPAAATGVAVNVTLPRDVTVASSTPGATVADGVVTWKSQTIPSGATVEYFVRATPTAAGLHPCTVEITCDNDAEWANNVAGLVDVPSACGLPSTFAAMSCHLDDLRAIAATLGLPPHLAAKLVAKIAHAARLANRAGVLVASGREQAARAIVTAAGRELGRVGNQFDGKPLRSALSSDVRYALQSRARLAAIFVRELVVK